MPQMADVWSGATYERIAETFAPIHDRVVDAFELAAGDRLLDVACGTGGVAVRAARRGADVVGIDISCDQLEKAKALAAAEGLAIEYDEGDCQDLPYRDGDFDVVVSVFGAVFAPDHGRAAAELARVCRPGGRLALTAWPHDAWSETHARAGRTFVEDSDARDWANEEHVRGLLDRDFDLSLDRGEWIVRAGSGDALWELLSTSAPPLRAWLSGLGVAERERAERVYLEFLAPGELRREYVLILGRRR